MKLVHSNHWQKKRTRRPEITDDLIEYAILHSPMMRDKHWSNAFNSLARVPSSGRMLKVVHKKISKTKI